VALAARPERGRDSGVGRRLPPDAGEERPDVQSLRATPAHDRLAYPAQHLHIGLDVVRDAVEEEPEHVDAVGERASRGMRAMRARRCRHLALRDQGPDRRARGRRSQKEQTNEELGTERTRPRRRRLVEPA